MNLDHIDIPLGYYRLAVVAFSVGEIISQTLTFPKTFFFFQKLWDRKTRSRPPIKTICHCQKFIKYFSSCSNTNFSPKNCQKTFSSNQKIPDIFRRQFHDTKTKLGKWSYACAKDTHSKRPLAPICPDHNALSIDAKMSLIGPKIAKC